MIRQFPTIEAFADAVGTDLGWSPWRTLDQDSVDRFGEITGADDWIHTDPERAASGPFGAPILQGDLILSTVPRMLHEIYRVDGVAIGMIYGSNKVRIPSPVAVGTPIRAHARLLSAEPGKRGTVFVIEAVAWAEGAERPSLVAEVVHLLSS